MRNEVRAPRLLATFRGSLLAGVISAEVESNNNFSADRFRLRLAADQVDQATFHIPGGELELSVDTNGTSVSWITGLIDTVKYDPALKTVDIEGRDLSSYLIETQIDETFSNRTSSEIALLVGLRHGLVVLADPTTTAIGRFYQSEHDRVSLSQFARTMTEWDLLAFLASREGFDLFVFGRILRFGLPVLTGGVIVRPSDCISLQFGHSINMARPIDVQVRSWSSKTGQTAVGEVSLAGLGSSWQRRLTRPNLTSSSAQQQAQRIAEDLKRHEWSASLTMPGDLELTSRSIVAIEDSHSPWDRLYRVAQISRRLDIKRGFTQRLSLQGIA